MHAAKYYYTYFIILNILLYFETNDSFINFILLPLIITVRVFVSRKQIIAQAWRIFTKCARQKILKY